MHDSPIVGDATLKRNTVHILMENIICICMILQFANLRFSCVDGDDNGIIKNFETYFQVWVFRPPKCHCHVNEWAKHINNFPF